MSLDLIAGGVLYKYILIRPLGSGHFGQVWLARDEALDKEVALKVIPSEQASVADALNEARLGNRLNHPNVMTIHGADLLELGQVKIVAISMSYIPTGSVIAKVNGAGFLNATDARLCIIDVLRGLEYLHNGGLLHNDIKPSNILVRPTGECLLTDFGISSVYVGAQGVLAPNSYRLHQAPETVINGEISPVTDVYQVGLTLLRLLHGVDCLRDCRERLGSAAFDKAKGRGRLLESVGPQFFVPSSLNRVIAKAIAPDPAKRFPSALEMRRALEKIMLHGHWDLDESGELVGRLNDGGSVRVKQGRRSPAPNGYFIETTRRVNGSTHERRVSRYCGSGLSEGELHRRLRDVLESTCTGKL